MSSPIDVRDKVSLLPTKPGVYQFYDSDGKILYVGKATNLKSRVSSYFAKHHPDGKTNALVRKIVDLRTIVVETPYDALLLENSLIKEYQPRYNIQLRDDKSYPWIRIRNEHFPRIEGMRNPEDDGSEYIGPFASVRTMQTLLKLVHQMYKLRTCNYDLSPANVAKASTSAAWNSTSATAKRRAKHCRTKRSTTPTWRWPGRWLRGASAAWCAC
jgi:excinuclease ABC subunit C